MFTTEICRMEGAGYVIIKLIEMCRKIIDAYKSATQPEFHSSNIVWPKKLLHIFMRSQL